MKISILKSNDSDSAIARRVSNMMLTNYKKGLAIANEELAEESGIPDTLVNPTETVRIRKQKAVPTGGPGLSKGYKIKAINASDVSNLSGMAGSQQAKEFITQSKVLDNELDHIIGHLKLNNADEFYENGRKGGVSVPYHIRLKREYDDLMADRGFTLSKRDRAQTAHDEYVNTSELNIDAEKYEMDQIRKAIEDLVAEYTNKPLPTLKGSLGTLSKKDRDARDALIKERKRIKGEKDNAERELFKRKTKYANFMKEYEPRSAEEESKLIQLNEQANELLDKINNLPNPDTAVEDLIDKGLDVDRVRYSTNLNHLKRKNIIVHVKEQTAT